MTIKRHTEPLSVAEYESLRTEIMQDAEQKVTIQLALFTISVGIVSAALISAASGENGNNVPNYWILAWICNSSYLFVILMLCILGRKNRAISRCSAYLLVNYSLNTKQLEKFKNNTFSYSDFYHSELPSWEINYRLAFRDIENNKTNHIVDKNKKDPLSKIRMTLSTFGYNHIGDCLATVVVCSTFTCIKCSKHSFSWNVGDIYFWFPLFFSFVIAFAIIGTNFIQSISKKRKGKHTVDANSNESSNQRAFHLFYTLSGQDYVFAQFATLFLHQRLLRITNDTQLFIYPTRS